MKPITRPEYNYVKTSANKEKCYSFQTNDNVILQKGLLSVDVIKIPIFLIPLSKNQQIQSGYSSYTSNAVQIYTKPGVFAQALGTRRASWRILSKLS